jgi:hypothetical protein
MINELNAIKTTHADQNACKEEIELICSKLAVHVEKYKKKLPQGYKKNNAMRLEKYIRQQEELANQESQIIQENREKLLKKSEYLLKMSKIYQEQQNHIRLLQEKLQNNLYAF